MTILESITTVYDYLVSHDSIDFESFRKDTNLISEDLLESEQIFEKSLEALETQGIVKKIILSSEKPKEIKNKWILVKPIQNYDQHIQINGDLAAAIARVVNKVCEVNGDKYRSDPLNISREDVKYLLAMLITLLDNPSYQSSKD